MIVLTTKYFKSPFDFFFKFRQFFITKHSTFSGLHLRKAYSILAEFLKLNLAKEESEKLLAYLTLDCLKYLHCGHGLPFEKSYQLLNSKKMSEFGIKNGYILQFKQPIDYNGIQASCFLVQNQGEIIKPLLV